MKRSQESCIFQLCMCLQMLVLTEGLVLVQKGQDSVCVCVCCTRLELQSRMAPNQVQPDDHQNMSHAAYYTPPRHSKWMPQLQRVVRGQAGLFG